MRGTSSFVLNNRAFSIRVVSVHADQFPVQAERSAASGKSEYHVGFFLEAVATPGGEHSIRRGCVKGKRNGGERENLLPLKVRWEEEVIFFRGMI